MKGLLFVLFSPLRLPVGALILGCVCLLSAYICRVVLYTEPSPREL